MVWNKIAIAMVGLFVCATIGVMPLGCGSRLEPVTAKQNGGMMRPNFPDPTVERMKECVAVYAPQLEPGNHQFDSRVEIDEDGHKVNVTIDDIPYTAHDFGACMRNALHDMPIADSLLHEGVERLKHQREQASTAQRIHMSSPVVVIVGVTVIVTEVVLEAGAYTILFATTVALLDKAARDVAELAQSKHERCVSRCLHLLPSPSGDLQSSEYRKCYRECMGRL